MRKTQFLGITELNPGEGLDADNYAFTGRDRALIDYGIHLGVKLHRHNGLDGMIDPTGTPSGVEVVASGGHIPTGVTISVGYTYEDALGGETRLSPTVSVTTGTPMPVPLTAPEATIAYGSGVLTTGTYYYALSWLDGEGGETPVGPTTSVDRQPGFANAQVALADLNEGMGGASASGWRLYRAVGGGSYDLLAEGTGSTFLDDGEQAVNCDLHPVDDSTNNTNQTNTLFVNLPPEPPPQDTEAVFINLYASLGNDFAESSLLAQYPIASAGETVSFTDLEFLPASPPDVNTSYGGANKIDPDTELIDYHWKRPVATKADLNALAAEEGDVRIVLDEHKAYIYTHEWQVWNQGGGGGGGGSLDVFMQGAHGADQIVIEDSFASGGLDSNWFMEEGAVPSEFFTEAGGKIVKVGGGAVMWHVDAVGRDGTIVSKFGGEESFACHNLHVLRSTPESAEGRLLAGYQGGFGHGNPASLVIVLENAPGGDWTLMSETFTEPAVGSFWIKTTIEGTVIVCQMFSTDPTVSGAEPIHEVEVDLADEALEPSLEELEPFFSEHGSYGLMFVGASGGATFEWNASLTEEVSDGYVPDAEFIEFASGAELDVASASLGGKTGAVVTLPEGGGGGLPEREWASATAAGMASGAQTNIDFDLPGAGADLIRLVTDHKARVRVYGDAAARTADAARAIGTDPTGDHGALLDYANNLEAGGGNRRLTPVVQAFNLDTPPQDKLYLRITNLESSEKTTTVAFLYLPKEG